MEQQIQDLIASIRKDGIESATNESKKILEEARKEADLILKEAKAEKEKIDGVGKILSEKLNGDLSKGIEFKASSLPNSGVKVYAKDGSAYIDLSDEECTRLLYPYLSSSLKELF